MNSSLIFRSLCTAFCLVLVLSCAKKTEETPPLPAPAELTTATVSGITQSAATTGGTITSDGGASITARGVCWSTSAQPTTADPHTTDGNGTGSFTSTMAGLTPNTLYNVRAYASNSAGTSYGNVLSLTTLKQPADTVTDFDGNVYHLVTIGNQVWLAENLKVTHYNDGTPIPNVTPDAQWKILTTGAWCKYDNVTSNATTYGLLYNWFAVTDSRNICPAGWHIPADGEWASLSAFLGGDATAGGKMKSTGTYEAGNGLWYAPNTGATNTSGFKALPAGLRINYGNYYSLGNIADFWCVSDSSAAFSWDYILDANNESLTRGYDFKTNGFSVRCIKD